MFFGISHPVILLSAGDSDKNPNTSFILIIDYFHSSLLITPAFYLVRECSTSLIVKQLLTISNYLYLQNKNTHAILGAELDFMLTPEKDSARLTMSHPTHSN